MTSRSTRREESQQSDRVRRTSTSPVSGVGPWVGPGVVILVFLGLTVWSWRKWSDPLVDFGRELYTPWQLVEGKVLYKDIGSLFGPLSQYWNALLFYLFGVSLTTLVFANLAVLAIMTGLLYKWLVSISDHLTAAASAVVLLTVFSFSQYTAIADYNFICPYSHEAVHGIALTVAMIYCLHRWISAGSLRDGALTGFCLGLVLLTKPEIGLGAAAAAASGIVAGSLRGNESACVLRGLPYFAAGALLPATLFFLYFFLHAPSLDAARFVLTGWTTLWRGEAAINAFYLNLIGLDEPLAHFIQSLEISTGIALFVGVAIVLDVQSERRLKYSFALCIACGAALFLTLLRLSDWIPWLEIGRPLPILVICLLALLLALYQRGRSDRTVAVPFCSLIAWAVFSLVLLGKIFFNVHLYHYGFYLAPPAMLLVVIGALWIVPRLLAHKWGCGRLFKGLALAALVALVVFYLHWSHEIYRLKTFQLGQDGDRFLTFGEEVDERGIAVRQALRIIDQVMPRNASFVVFPEGVMLNYLSRRTNPTPFINFMVPELREIGEANVLSALKSTEPDFIVVAHRDTSEYGVGFFGSDPSYGKAIMDWVGQHYAGVALIGNEPLQEARFGIKVLKRRTS